MDNLGILMHHIKDMNGFESVLGKVEITDASPLGQGGNAVALSGKMFDFSVAIKFLLNTEHTKLDRFKAEYLNTTICKSRLENVVDAYHYGELIIEGVPFPYIIMKQYMRSLRKYRQALTGGIEFEQFKNLWTDLMSAIASLEQCGIIHRDLKPENILLDENGEFIIADLGIAHFAEEESPIVHLTEKGERLANFEFSAPEQLSRNCTASYASDIYAFAQIMYWFAFGEINRGTRGHHLSEIFPEIFETKYYDICIYWCLSNDKDKRPQSVSDIQNWFERARAKDAEVNPFDDMHKFTIGILRVMPEFNSGAFFTDSQVQIRDILEAIASLELKRKVQFNTGSANNEIYQICPLDDGSFLLNEHQILIKKIWGSVGANCYDDIILLEYEQPEPYLIDGKPYYGVAIINDDEIVPADFIASGFVRYKGKVYDTRDIKIQERYIYDYDKSRYIALGLMHHCSIYFKNDPILRNLQSMDMSAEHLIAFNRVLAKNKHPDIYEYL